MWGCGKIAEVISFYVTNDSDDEIVGYCVDEKYINDKEQDFMGHPLVAFSMIEKVFPPKNFKMLIPIGYKDMNRIRAEKYTEAKKKGYQLATYISSKATYYGTHVGENSIILENNVIQPYTYIGDNTILWSGNHIGHHAKIGNHCFVSSHVVVSGSVIVEDYSFLGVNATLRDNITIASSSLIGAGAAIMHDTEAGSVYVPAKSIKRGDVKGM